MKKKIFITLVVGGLIFLTSCAKDEECVCSNTDNITESDAKDVGVSLDTACELAKIGDETCKVE
ncbi:MAG: hypothetical protein QNK84_08035 [Flavobacteriales bacterium]|jgi:hypothetical protein